MTIRVRQQLDKALLYIEQHINQKFTAVQVAEHACISPFHFQRLFSVYLGETVNQYTLHRRLEIAAKLLINQKSLPIVDIARRTGFEAHSNFSRVFKKHFELSPSDFRIDPRLAKTGHDNTRPYLKTCAAKHKSIDVTVNEQSTLWFNYKANSTTSEVSTEEADFDKNVMHIAIDFNDFLDEGRAHLFGVATSRVDGYSSRAKSINDMFSSLWHGAVYSKKNNDDWSDKWFEIEAGLWAVCTHKGHFKYSYQTWNRIIYSWLPESGYQLRDTISFERYLTSPLVVQNSDEWLTQIYIPIKKAEFV